MSWFGGGAKKEATGEKGFVDNDEAQFNSSVLSGGGSVGGGGGGGLAEFQEFSMAIQQQMVIQQAITELCDKSFQKCITSTKDSTLTGKEVACVAAVTNKWLDCNTFMIGRLAKKGQAASAAQSFG
jgi:Tim10/DDP family zinc finger